LLGWLEERPDLKAKGILKRLQVTGYGEFPDEQLLASQRRVLAWRARIVQQLVYRTEQQTTESTEERYATSSLSADAYRFDSDRDGKAS
jgi:c-di-GMP-binding flagellar brake protein YcgR